MGYKVAVAGATGNVGREILNILHERNFPADEVIPLASEASIGKEVSYGEDDVLTVQALNHFDFKGTDLGLFSPGGAISAEHAPRAAAAGCVVIDNTSHFRMDPDVPLVVPEVNPQALDGYAERNIIANLNCSTIQMVVAFKPLHDAAKIKRVVVSTYQSVSGAPCRDGRTLQSTRQVYVNDPIQPIFTKRISFNVIPHIDKFMDDGSTKEEWKMVVETKILTPIFPSLRPVRVPVFIGHAEAVHLEFENPIDEDMAREVLSAAPGVVVVDHRADEGYVTPEESATEDDVYVSRIRTDPTVENGLAIWVVSITSARVRR